MSRYIDAEWLMNFFVDIPDNFTLTIGNLRATVNEAPSIDIVFCKECKHKDKIANYCHENDRNIEADDFCSYGERRAVKEVIMKVPSFSADYPKAPIYVAELVRCGECIYWKNSLCQAWHRVIPKDGYCSIGEKDVSTQTETQNSNLAFEKRTMRDCYNCKRYEAEGECIECHYEPKDEPQTEEWTKEKHEAFYTFLWNTINPNEMEEYIEMYEAKGEPQTERNE